jgi:integrase
MCVALVRMLAYPKGTQSNKRHGNVMRVLLTDRLVAGARPAGKQTEYFDAKARGLSLRINQAGSRSWYWHFTGADRRRGRTLLGTYPAMSLAAARGAAVEARSLLESGADPRARTRDAMTVATLVETYMARRVRPNLRGAKHVEHRLNKNVVPVIGGVPLGNLHRRDITRVIDAIMDRGHPAEANRVMIDLRAMLRWAVARGDLDRDPAAGVSLPAEVRSRDRVLSDDEIARVWQAMPMLRDSIPQLTPDVQRVIRLCLITGQRSGEVTGMTQAELDLPAREWHLPASRSKNKHAHTIPLSDMALEIIGEAIAPAGPRQGLFAATANTVACAVKKAQAAFGIPQWTPHDLRRTALTGMAALGIEPIIIGHVANHRTTTKAGVTLGIYVRHTYADEKRRALDLWADRLAVIVAAKS